MYDRHLKLNMVGKPVVGCSFCLPGLGLMALNSTVARTARDSRVVGPQHLLRKISLLPSEGRGAKAIRSASDTATSLKFRGLPLTNSACAATAYPFASAVTNAAAADANTSTCIASTVS